MLKKSKFNPHERLRKNQDFQRVYKNARKFYQQGLTVFVSCNELTYSRLGISISKRKIPRAVDRNRVKRLIRECFREKKNDLKVCLDMVFVVHSPLLRVNLEINTCLENVWRKLIDFYDKGSSCP